MKNKNDGVAGELAAIAIAVFVFTILILTTTETVKLLIDFIEGN